MCQDAEQIVRETNAIIQLLKLAAACLKKKRLNVTISSISCLRIHGLSSVVNGLVKCLVIMSSFMSWKNIFNYINLTGIVYDEVSTVLKSIFMTHTRILVCNWRSNTLAKSAC